MPRPKKRPDTQEQANQTQDTPKPETRTNGQEGGVRVNKMDLVRKALRRLGNDAKPKRIQGYLKKRYGLEMSNDMISTYKGNILKKAAGESRIIPNPKRRHPGPRRSQRQTAATSASRRSGP